MRERLLSDALQRKPLVAKEKGDVIYFSRELIVPSSNPERNRDSGSPNPDFFSPPAEYIESIGDGKSEDYKEAERKRIMELVDNF